MNSLAPRLRILVVLPRHLDVAAWTQRFVRGEVVDETPYGYHFANRYGCQVSFSRPTPYWPGALRFFDRALRKILGFDLRHIWANRQLLTSEQFDCVWTHTECEHLGLGVFKKISPKTMPALIAQSIWLIDEWARYSAIRRSLYRWLMRDFEVLTFHSPLNAQRAKSLRLGRRVEVLKFGISLDSFPAVESAPRPLPATVEPKGRIRILAMGNDRHRDWATLVEALGGHPDYEIRVGSNSFPSHLARSNIQAGPMTQAEVMQSYAWADCVVLPLRANLHVSGMTTALEAIAMKVPLIASEAGGLSAYFDGACVSYFPIGQALALRRCVDVLMAKPVAQRQATSLVALRSLIDQQLSSEGFAQRHAQLSRELIEPPAATTRDSA
jgi:glycosyltransferase involved in cell wall biosynthesis